MNDSEIQRVWDKLDVITETLSQVKTDVSWLKQFFWLIATVGLANLAGFIFNILKAWAQTGK